jgi:hypothetical protein
MRLRDQQNDERVEDPGVPEALPRTLQLIRDRLDPDRMDRLWVFPPLKRGRRERGVVAVSLLMAGEERRRLLTVAYSAERSGRSLSVDHSFHEEGDAPPEFLPRVMEGVVRRAGEGHGDPREVAIEGAREHFEALMEEFDPDLLLSEQT